MAQFSTTDMYLAAYMKDHCVTSHNEKVGGKVMFVFRFDDDDRASELHNSYLEDVALQSFINNVKELRGKVYQLMKEYNTALNRE